MTVKVHYEATGNYYKEFTVVDVMRLFIAVEVNDEKVLNSIRELQRTINVNAKPVNVELLHFTLLFLGEVNQTLTSKISDALGSIKFSPFFIEFVGVGAFPNPNSPRVIWVGTDNNGGAKLRELAETVEKTLKPLGFHSDKRFKPHITIFRVKNKIKNVGDELKKYEKKEFGQQKVSKVKLKKSTLTSDGPVYEDLKVVFAS